jgi:four helix bundle protein
MDEKNVEKVNNYIKLQDLEVYKLAWELSRIGWDIYQIMSWQDKKIMGDQFITATDSFGANFTEGYKRFHYLDKIKFYYNARASLSEACEYWLEILLERGKIQKEDYAKYKKIAASASVKLQKIINSNYEAKRK